MFDRLLKRRACWDRADEEGLEVWGQLSPSYRRIPFLFYGHFGPFRSASSACIRREKGRRSRHEKRTSSVPLCWMEGAHPVVGLAVRTATLAVSDQVGAQLQHLAASALGSSQYVGGLSAPASLRSGPAFIRSRRPRPLLPGRGRSPGSRWGPGGGTHPACRQALPANALGEGQLGPQGCALGAALRAAASSPRRATGIPQAGNRKKRCASRAGNGIACRQVEQVIELLIRHPTSDIRQKTRVSNALEAPQRPRW